MAKHKKLFIPGPVEVHPDVRNAATRPMIGHRMKEYDELGKSIYEKLKKLLYTENPVMVATCSATGIMEGSIRNCVSKRVLSCVNGAFSQRWHEIALSCNKEATRLDFEWGKPVTPEAIDKELATGNYDAVTIVSNETSTGVYSDISAIAKVMKKYPDVFFLVDAVSCMTGLKIEVDKLGIDVCLAGTQKAFALPPGLCVFSCSQKVLDKSKDMTDKGTYFDFTDMYKFYLKNQTPSTPAISLMYQLDFQLDRFFKEGLEKRFERHLEMAEYCRNWAVKNGFEIFPEKGFESVTLTTIKNTKNISISDLNKKLGEEGFTISNGYGKLKENTFRIAHMGDCTLPELKEVLELIEKYI
jgi:aspartate aminotransferase-like enzyme